MKTEVDKAIAVLAAQHGKNEAEKCARRLRSELGLPVESTYSIPQHVNEGVLTNRTLTAPVVYRPFDPRTSVIAGPPVKRTRTAASLAKQAASMRRVWREKRAQKRGK